MTDEQIVLTVARALEVPGKWMGHEWLLNPDEIGTNPEWFNPLTDNQWAVPMMVWLVEHRYHIRMDSDGVFVHDAIDTGYGIAARFWHQCSDKEAAILRCLCEAVARVAEEEK